MRRTLTMALLLLAGVSVGLFVAIQFVPYRVENPPITGTPAWSSPEVEALARRACFDCHSHETVTPWYGQIAPIAWYVNDHVLEGREKLNFSAMDQPQEDAHEAGEVITEGEMPPAYYLRLHPEARLTPAEKATLVAGLDQTLGGEGASGGSEGSEHEDDD